MAKIENTICLRSAKSKHQRKFRAVTFSGCGFTIIEGVIAALIVAIVILGTICMRYHSTLDAKRSDIGAIASRLALLLNEAWRGAAGSETYDPVATFQSDMAIKADDGPEPPSGFTLLGKYNVELNDFNYYATLSYQDINSDLRALNSNIAWEQRSTPETDFDDSDKSFGLTIYVNK